MPTRRQLLKWGAIAAGTIFVPVGFPQHNLSPRLLRVLAHDDADDFASPPTRPFVDPLPVPPLVTDSAPFAPNPHVCRYDDTSALRYVQLVEEEAFVRVHSDLPPTRVWRYRDTNVPASAYGLGVGPTVAVKMGPERRTVLMRVKNRLPADHVGFGVPCTTVHLHGGQIDSLADGFPESQMDGPVPHPIPVVFVPPGFAGFEPLDDDEEALAPLGCRTCDLAAASHEFDYCYGMQDPGWTNGEPVVGDRPSSLWYHDHLFDFTGPNVYAGLAGFYLVFDELDSGNEEEGLRLPSGPKLPGGVPNMSFDIPLLISDALFDGDGQKLYLPGNHDGFLGDKILVNGVIQPYLRVKGRKYRFRILDASNARFYQLHLVDRRGRSYPFDLIAHGGGLLSFPLRNRESLFIYPAERKEIVTTSRSSRRAPELFLENRLVQEDGRGPKGDPDDLELLDRGTRILKFIVDERVSDPSQVPDELRPFDPISASELASARRRRFVLGRRHGAWVINRRLAELDFEHTMATPRLNEGEIWIFENKGGGWWHPMHVHAEFMRVIRRNGREPALDERDGVVREDTIAVGPNEVFEVFLKFRDYPGPFVFHCHNLEHEDMRMMARFDVLPS